MSATKKDARRKRVMIKPENLIFTLVAAVFLAGCTQPLQDYSYVNLNRLKGWQDNTPVHLNFEMPDSTTAYELYIVGEIATKRTIDKGKGYPIDILLVAPDSTEYTDSIMLPVNVVTDEQISRISHGIRVIEWPYRKNIYNSKPGKWSIFLTKGDTTDNYSNIIGMGVYCKKREL